jgi:hypothetical protein
MQVLALLLAAFGAFAWGEAAPIDEPAVLRRIERTGDARSAEYSFTTFRQGRIRIEYRISEADFQRYNSTYGYRPEHIAEIRRRRDEDFQAAFRGARAKRQSQSELDAEVDKVRRRADGEISAYLTSCGFRVETGGVTRVDLPALVRRNAPQVRELARAFETVADQRRYDSEDVVGSVLSFVQTALEYRQPDVVFHGKHTGGILPPLTAALLGWGDCDTKTGLAASLLANWPQMKMVGVALPGHYLMATLKIPEKGDLYVEYEGLKYVLLEPAGPAWLPPGRVSEETMLQLNSADGYKIEPFF